MLITLENLTKSYGNHKALDNINLILPQGKIIGLLGPNGSGKTTLIKVLVGLLRQFSGSVKINGIPLGEETKAMISYLADKNAIPTFWSIQESCRFFADFFADFDKDKAQKILHTLKLDEKSKIKSLSKGNQEKVALMLTLSRNAKLYIFDEPIAGVDPVARENVFKLILENYAKDASVILATHLLNDVQKIIDEAIFLKEGKVALYQSLEQILSQYPSLEEAFKESFK